MKQLSLLALAIAVMGFFACGKRTAESESKQWQSNQSRINALKSKYPNFQSVLETVFKDAEAAFKAAEGISNEEEKVKAMTAANQKASPSFVVDLEGMDRLYTDLNDQISKAKQNGGDANDKSAIYDAAMRADMTMRNAKNSITMAQPVDVASANMLVKTAKDNIAAAQKTISDLVAAATKKVNDAKKAEDDAKNAAAKAEEDKKAAAADCKCKACGTMNKAGITQCTQCTAPLECKK